ncbi:MAG: efflux RND transporter periplasmic adaptor subunit [Melioribacteraceae bacterium]|nr:efflux RND transporter periplasmic adaptor subunit [Melioribacteraceae bacterium]MCF8414234.1 efflux RND transporter periplasmic adaptor subunit [Melioribacteraceae bacterium]MCF8431138.1 efflux RND transporter periplasmic adaptor subunit [Melioribacteraceae bacterium]
MKKETIIKISSVVVIIIFGFFGMSYLSSAEIESNKRDVKPDVRVVETNLLAFGDYELKVEGNGTIQSKRTLRMVAEVGGKVIFAKNDLKNGTEISKDELILQLDSREIENNLFSMRSDFMNSLASVLPDLKVENNETYEKWYKYFSSIEIENEIADLPEIKSTQEKIKISSRNILTKYYAIKNQEIELARHQIKAPFDGYINSDGIIENSFVSRGQYLCTVNDVKNLEIAIPLLVDEFNMMKNGNSTPIVKIYADDDSDNYLIGKVVRRETTLNPNSQTLTAFVQLENPKLIPSFLPGNYVKVEIDGKTLSNVAAVPRYTVSSDYEIYTNEGGKLGKRKIDIVAFQGEFAIIQNKWSEPVEVVTTILQKPLLGMEIQTVEEKELAESSTAPSPGTTAAAN